MPLDYTQLEAEIDANPTVDGSLRGLVDLYIAMVNDLKTQIPGPEAQAKIDALTTKMRDEKEKSLLFVTNNTPSQQPPAPIGTSVGVDERQAAARAVRANNPGGLGGTPRPQ